MAVVASACESGNDSSGSQTVLASTVGPTVPNPQAPSVSFQVVNGSGAVVYSSSSGTQAANLLAGQAVELQVNSSNLPSGATVSISVTNDSVVGSSPQVIPVTSASVSYTPTVQGDYSFTLTVANSSGSTVVTKYFALNVQCASPTFTASSLNGAGLAVTAGSAENLFNFSAANVVTSADGQAPYQCAFDLTGVGIVDTPFAPCSQAVTNQYVPYINTRNIGVVVKDACNTSQTITNAQNLVAATPAMGVGNVFIEGVVSNETGTVATDPRINNVNYLWTNTNGNVPVLPQFDGNTFTIQASTQYSGASSVPFGVQIVVAGIGGTFNLDTNPTGTVDMASAYVQSISYATDEAGDQNPSVTLSSSTCTTTGLFSKVVPVVGAPCANNTETGSNNSATVEIWGTYTCTKVSDAGGAATMSGEFDGLTQMSDSCVGGGGQGGGGIVPVSF